MKKTDEMKLYEKLPVEEMRKALRKRIQAYQLENHHRLTDGHDHWDWFFDGRKPQPGQWTNRMKFIWEHTKKGISPEMRLRKLELTTKGKAVKAFLQDGRWVAKCPDCFGQEVVTPDIPLFVCLNIHCLDLMNNHWPRPIIFPSAENIAKLESILLLRINPINRNWNPEDGETIQDLERENVRHGLPKNLEELRKEK